MHGKPGAATVSYAMPHGGTCMQGGGWPGSRAEQQAAHVPLAFSNDGAAAAGAAQPAQATAASSSDAAGRHDPREDASRIIEDILTVWSCRCARTSSIAGGVCVHVSCPVGHFARSIRMNDP